MANKLSIVLVHGLWADGSCWNDIIPALQADGHEVVAVQNPLTSLADDVAATARALARVAGPTLLVGHSWGGFVISEAGNHAQVAGLVYVAALAPDAGETVVDLLGRTAPTPLGQYFEQEQGHIWLSEEGVRQAFAADVPAAVAARLYATQTAPSAAVLGEQLSHPAWKSKPSWFVVARHDQAVHPDLQRLEAERMGATTVEVDTSHVPMISRPDEVLRVIRAAAAQVG